MSALAQNDVQRIIEIEKMRADLLSSPLDFTAAFFKARRGQSFKISNPSGRECRYRTIFRQLKRVFRGECKRLIITIPPRYGKSESVIHFVAWVYAHYADCNTLYVSFSQSVATRQTQTIKDIMENPLYRKLFDVSIDQNSKAKHNFRTSKGGEIFAAGAGGSITSRGAGISGLGSERFGGLIVIDDIHKPTDVHSDTIRKSTNDWYFNTLQSRLNDPMHTPIIVIGQRLHEDDLIANLLMQENPDGSPEWELITLPVLDGHQNPLDEEKHTKELLLEMQKREKYSFSAQYMQNPLPAGGGLFRKEDFKIYDEEPDIVQTFLSVDTAESQSQYADATVFSFWGLYKIVHSGIDTGMWGLHWLACRELRIEPRDLHNEFIDFYSDCMRHRVKPGTAIIERASTGVTLCSVLQGTPGLRILDLRRTVADGSKTDRFIKCERYIAENRISFTEGAKHIQLCVNHCAKITANDSHLHDDIADTMSMAIEAAFINETVLPVEKINTNVIARLNSRSDELSKLRRSQNAGNQL